MRAPYYSDQADELLSPAAIERPQTIYSRLRETRPIARIGESGVHLVATWDLIEEALGREADFSANLTGVLFRDANGEPAAFEIPQTGATDVIATADEPGHSIHRALAQPRMVAERIAPFEPRLRKWTQRALDPLLAAGGGDFTAISELVPALTVAHLLGLPEADVSRFRVWAMTGGDMLAGEVDAERLEFLARTTADMSAYLGQHLDRFREIVERDPRDEADLPLLHALALGVHGGEIDRATAVGIAIVMFGAGGESTAALIGSALRRLAEDPALAQQLRGDATLVPRFVEEMVRLEPPFNFHYRAVRRPCELGGFSLEPGDRLMLLWASANRDPSVFDDPDTLRLDRRFPKKHMGFGRGLHFCIGAHLARLEARVVVEEVLAATDQIAPQHAEEPVSARRSEMSRADITRTESDPHDASYAQYANSIFIRRLERLELEVAPRSHARPD